MRVVAHLLWQVASLAENKFARRSAYVGHDGVPRVLQPRPSDAVLAPVELAPCWDPGNRRHTHRELFRYREATQMAFDKSQFISMGGPDGTKVGTELALQAAVIMNQATGTVAVCPPQAPE